MLELKTYVDKFKEDINNENFKNIKDFDTDNIEMFVLALKLGYKDAQRTFTNVNQSVWQKHTGSKEAFYNTFSKELQKIFKKEIDFSPEALFDKFIKFFQNYGYTVTYGQAQKVINMSFKYLYCVDSKNEYKDLYAKCHMPLDSFTIQWYKRHIYPISKNTNCKISANDTWSNMDDPQKYQAIVNDIKLHLHNASITLNGVKEDLPPTPLEAEFVIWPEEVMNQTVANFNKAIDKNYKETDDYRKMLEDTEQYIKRLKG